MFPTGVIASLLFASCGDSAPGPDRLNPGDSVEVGAPVAFVAINVVPLTSETVLRNYTVLVEGQRITGIGPTESIEVPDGWGVIDGTDRYLMPGLVDMHIHTSGGTRDAVRNDMVLFLANGVTSVRIMWGNRFSLGLRDEVEAGEPFLPTPYVASPGMDGPAAGFNTPAVTTVEQATATVRQYSADGYHFMKVYNTLSPEVYRAIHEESQRQGIRVIGHTPGAIPYETVVSSGQFTNEHLLGLEIATARGNMWRNEPDWDRVRELARLAAAAGMAETPTTMVFTKISSERAAYLSSDEAKYVSPGVLEFSTNVLTPWPAQWDHQARMRRTRRMLQILHEEGVPLLLGTDAGVRMAFPGFSILEELDILASAGLTPYEVFRTGTVNASRYLLDEDDFGTVELGKRADLVVLNENPLESVAAFRSRVGVMVRGRWYRSQELAAKLEDIVAGYGR